MSDAPPEIEFTDAELDALAQVMRGLQKRKDMRITTGVLREPLESAAQKLEKATKRPSAAGGSDG